MSTIITYITDGIIQAAIVDSVQLGKERIGREIEIDDKILETSTPYGVDWSVVFPDGLVIDPATIQGVLYNNGIISLQDVLSNTNAVVTAVNQLTRLTGARLIQNIRKVMEASND
jgi:hypothetical protein